MAFRAAAFALALGLTAPAVGASRYSPARDPCPFGYGTGCGNANITPATKAQVAKILEGILGRLTSHKASLLREATGRGQVTTEAKAELRGLLQRLRGGDSSKAAAVEALAAEVARESPDAGCRYFGACGGSDKPMDAATKAQVAALLNGILGRLQR
ncbi:unnamed protein product [Prorocentrum cordatum]|uniref:Uncharacterized protein n=1 Tax=Prorocentrum cordatum TaxID=2364126 RepID=A0ABN9UWA8_9DINO|nr:unnamed protein product [Polarella glacialis]|mmetsp:Transcript_119548/g.320892  ORF Transcript_119548/g.320892 Transcript_119548/m.320892 type:complete len:157 (-) Transcript_119548:128-598(-)